MRDLIMSGGPWTEKERQEILDYCETDVVALRKLLEKMLPKIDLPHALLRGAYMKAVACIEFNGTPIDSETLLRVKDHWGEIQSLLIEKIDSQYGVYDGKTFKSDRFATFLANANIPWPRLDSGKLALDDETFRQMARRHPIIAPLRELRTTLSKMRLSDLSVGDDSRNRCLLSPFASKTGRNQPSNSKFIFGPSVWLRSFIKPTFGYGLAYIDYSQQEFGIAAALSGDNKMKEAYSSGDPYLAFAKQAGAAPSEATKQTHKAVREQYKECALGVQYGMGEEALATKINRPVIEARELLKRHRQTYPTFWEWSDAAVNHAVLYGFLPSIFGWKVLLGHQVNPRSLRNFPMQANGAEMLRLACILAMEKKIKVCAPVHDALLIEAPACELEEAVKVTQDCMEQASKILLNGFRIRTDSSEVLYPDRYEDERGKEMWQTVNELVFEIENRSSTCPTGTHGGA